MVKFSTTRLFLATLMLLASVSLSAAPVSQRQAAAIAKAFMQQKGIITPKTQAPRRSMPQKEQTGSADYYIYNATQDKGFVIVSGDDRTPQILGYSDSGSLDINNLPSNISSFLQSYADGIKYLNDKNITAKQNVSMTNTGITENVTPLLSSKWNQSSPYNNLCPQWNSLPTVTGCVATAMAQVMYYYKYPNQTIADIPSYSYTANSITNNIDGVAAGTAFDWDDMLPTYSSSATDNQNTAVATLMNCAGRAVKMQYMPASYGGSAAYNSDIAPALQKYFDYSATNINRENYTLSDFENKIYDELVASRPVIFCGQSTGGGHCFVIDGFDAANGLFHVNWGWGGQSDGYFLISVLNPGDNSGIGASTSTDGYSMDQSAIIGIAKGAGSLSIPTDNTPQPSNVNNLSVSNWEFTGSKTANTSQPVTITINNAGTTEYYGTVYLYVSTTDSKGESYSSATGLTAPNGSSTIEMTFNPTSTGTYHLWLCAYDGSTLKNLGTTTVDIAEASTTERDLSRTITAQNANGNTVYGNAISGNVTVKNNDDTDFSGLVTLYIGSLGEDNYFHSFNSIGKSISITANGETSFDFNFTGLENSDNGTAYGFWIRYNNSNIGSAQTYYLKPGIITYNADGTQTAVAPTATVTMSSDATSIDLSEVESTVTAVTANENPNALYIFNSADATAAKALIAEGKNVIANGEIDNLTLTDGYDFNSPIDFTAATATFKRTMELGTDGTTPAWYSICLPFEASSITVDGQQKGWFTSSTDTGKHLWVMKFSALEGNNVKFDFNDANVIEANIPYIIEVPGNRWGDAWNLAGKQLTFTGSNVSITANANAVEGSDLFNFVGTTRNTTLPAYILNTEENNFVYSNSGKATPFSAYFVDRNHTSNSLSSFGIIFGNGEATGIKSIINNMPIGNTAEYNLSGQRVDKDYKGIIIKNGKKIIRK